MERIFHLKKVIAVIENDSYRESVEVLLGRVEEQGIHCKWYTAAQLAVQEESGENTEDNPVVHSSALWITDSEEWAANLRNKGLAVLGYLHPGNRGKSFQSIQYCMEVPEELDAVYLENVYRRYINIPWDIIDTPRCHIRETTEEDVDAFYGIYSEPEIVRYMEGLYPEEEQERRYIREYIEKVYFFYGFGVWTVIKKDTQEIIGRAGFSYREGYEEPEIGFVIGVPWQRQGIALEICNALLEYGEKELGFGAVQALVEPENKASLVLCRRLGFREIGNVREMNQEFIRLLRD